MQWECWKHTWPGRLNEAYVEWGGGGLSPSKCSLMRNWSSLFPSTMALLWIKRTLTALEVIQLANSSQTPTCCSDIVICGVYLAKQIWTRLAACPSPVLPSFSIISKLSCTFYPIKRDGKARKSSYKNPLKHLLIKLHYKFFKRFFFSMTETFMH